jgi:putative ABC transport system permease protein
MFDLDKWNEIYATVSRNKLRTFLTAFGVFWGIFMLVVLLGFGNGFANGVINSIDVAKNAVFVWSQRTSKEYMGLKVGRIIKFNNEDVLAIRQQIPEIKVIAPSNQLRGNFAVNRNTKSASYEVRGEYPEFLQVKPIKIKEGRFVNEKDLLERRKIAVIGSEVQKVMFAENENAIGQYIKIKGIFFKVVGIFQSKGNAEDSRQDAQTIYIPNTTLQYAYNQINQVDYFAFVPKEGVKAEIIEFKVKKLLAERHKVAPDDLKAFGSANVEKEFDKINGLFLGIQGFSWLVSIGTILAGIIGVSNIMLIVVRERTKEIGIRKALGATPWSIISLILQESIVLTSLAGYMGLLAGVGFVAALDFALKKFEAEGDFFANPEINLTVAFVCLSLLVIFGALAGLIPATKAAAVNPIVALKDE